LHKNPENLSASYKTNTNTAQLPAVLLRLACAYSWLAPTHTIDDKAGDPSCPFQQRMATHAK
jgi:hypothetical protein